MDRPLLPMIFSRFFLFCITFCLSPSLSLPSPVTYTTTLTHTHTHTGIFPFPSSLTNPILSLPLHLHLFPQGRGGWTDPRHLDAAWVSVRLRDVNDNPPVFHRPHAHVTVREDAVPGTLLAALPAHDPDMVSRIRPRPQYDE